MKERIILTLLILLGSGCSTKKIIDRSLINNHGMDFNNSLSIPSSSSRYFLGRQSGQGPTGGCDTCAK